jgi:hypothetical protein
MFFEIGRHSGEQGVKGQEEVRRQEEEEGAHGEGGDEFDFQGGVGEDEGGPGKVEEEEVERGAVGGEAGEEEYGQQREG